MICGSGAGMKTLYFCILLVFLAWGRPLYFCVFLVYIHTAGKLGLIANNEKSKFVGQNKYLFASQIIFKSDLVVATTLYMAMFLSSQQIEMFILLRVHYVTQ